jgi:cytochrome d ubiquinol oxidase subunit I
MHIILSRWQFAITSIYHFFFVPLTLGLGWFVAIMETRYVRTGDETYKRMAKFWGTLFLINFAMGVVTGIVQEFQFGMNWSRYSRFVGDIFGAPLAIEALLAFFLESTFLGIWIFGWDQLSKKLHAAAIWLVVIGSNLSALWILIANGWMQHPVGYMIQNGRAEMVGFGALVFNPKAWFFFWHTISSGLATAAFFVLGISAWHLLRKKETEFFKRSFHLATIIGVIAVFSVILAGHAQGQEMRTTQPMKLAALEAMWKTEKPASFSLLTIGDLSGRKEVWSIRIPYVMSILACNNLTCELQGVNDLQAQYVQEYGPGNYIPLMVVTYWAFRFMFAAGFLMLGLAAYALYHVMRDRLTPNMRWLGLFVWAIALPYLANTSGWILTEMGRQPWIVYGLLKTDQAASPLTTGQVLTTVIGFTLVYGLLMAADVYLLTKYAKAGPSSAEGGSPKPAPALVDK